MRSSSRRSLAIALAAILVGSGFLIPSGDVSALASADATLEGILRMLTADTLERPADATSHDWRGVSHDHARPVLVVGDAMYFLKGSKAQRATPNRKVRVVGVLRGQTLEADGITDLGPAPGSIAATGTTRVLVMLAHWSAPDSVTPAYAATQMFTDSNGWYRDASYTSLGQTGDVTSWMAIAGPVGGACYGDSVNTMTQAKNAAVARGYVLSDYDNFVLYAPNNAWQAGSDCNAFAGWANVGAQDTWLNGYMDRRVTVHEQGHNYGLWHSHSYLCSNGGTSGSCSWVEYGDWYDAMGDSVNVGHFNAAQKDLLGWMGGRARDLTAGGSATLAPLASDALNIKAAFVRVSPSRTYWLEYRQALDYDSSMPPYATDGVQVRVVDSSIGLTHDSGSNLLDVRPADGVGPDTATLRQGQSWTSVEGWRFTVNSLSPTAAGISVVVGGGDAQPTITARTPAVNATNVSRTANVTATLSEAVTGVSGSTFTLKNASTGSGIAAAVSRNGTTNQWILNPGVTLASATRYIVTLTGGPNAIRDLANNPLATTSWSFTTSGSAPTITARTPKVNATNVSRTVNITATFSEEVTGVSGTTFTLKTSTGTVLPAVVARNGTTNQWILNPNASLANDTTYTVTLQGGSTAIRDLAGDPLVTTSWSFLTGPRPTITARTPAANATNVSRTANVTATFSEAVTGVSGSTFTLKNASTGAVVTSVVSRNGTTNQWLLDPSVTLASGTRYTVTLTGGPNAVRDLAGNPLATTSWSFTAGG